MGGAATAIRGSGNADGGCDSCMLLSSSFSFVRAEVVRLFFNERLRRRKNASIMPVRMARIGTTIAATRMSLSIPSLIANISVGAADCVGIVDVDRMSATIEGIGVHCELEYVCVCHGVVC